MIVFIVKNSWQFSEGIIVGNKMLEEYYVKIVF